MRRGERARSLVGISRASLLALLASAAANSGQGQSIDDVVRDHVEDELEAPKERERKRKPEPKSKPKPRAGRRHEPASTSPEAAANGLELSTEAPAAPSGPPLPQRILGENLKIDLKLGGGFRGWYPQQYPNVDVEAGSYWVWTIEVKAKLFRFLNLRRGYYESNGLAGPRTEEAAVASQVGSYVPKAAWLLGVLGFPFFKIWEPIIRYESRAFQTSARPESPICVVTPEVADDLSACERSRDPLRMISGFETLVLGVRYDRSKDPSAVLQQRDEKMPPLTFGIGLMQYRKPYQVTIDQNTLEEYLFNGRFRGAGLAFAIEIAGGPDRLHVDLDAQVGLGEVKLTDGVTLNSLAPEDWLIGYVQGTATIGYHWPLLRSAPTLMLVPELSGGGASFFFFKTDQERGERNEAATVNWDFLWSVHASLVLSL